MVNKINICTLFKLIYTYKSIIFKLIKTNNVKLITLSYSFIDYQFIKNFINEKYSRNFKTNYNR